VVVSEAVRGYILRREIVLPSAYSRPHHVLFASLDFTTGHGWVIQLFIGHCGLRTLVLIGLVEVLHRLKLDLLAPWFSLLIPSTLGVFERIRFFTNLLWICLLQLLGRHRQETVRGFGLSDMMGRSKLLNSTLRGEAVFKEVGS
jgi:hypothetical protein